MRLIAFLTEPASIRALLAHLGEPTTPPALAPRARDPPELDAGVAFPFDQSPLINHPSALLLLPLGCFAVVANPPLSPQTPLPLHSVAKTRPLAPSP